MSLCVCASMCAHVCTHGCNFNKIKLVSPTGIRFKYETHNSERGRHILLLLLNCSSLVIYVQAQLDPRDFNLKHSSNFIFSVLTKKLFTLDSCFSLLFLISPISLFIPSLHLLHPFQSGLIILLSYSSSCFSCSLPLFPLPGMRSPFLNKSDNDC